MWYEDGIHFPYNIYRKIHKKVLYKKVHGNHINFLFVSFFTSFDLRINSTFVD